MGFNSAFKGLNIPAWPAALRKQRPTSLLFPDP